MNRCTMKFTKPLKEAKVNYHKKIKNFLGLGIFPEGGSRSIYVIIIYLKMINQIFCH